MTHIKTWRERANERGIGSCEARDEEINELRAALAQQGEPVAYITETEQGSMVWTPEMYGEACTYCDDGEFPVPLYTAAPAPAPVAQQGEQQPVCAGCGIPEGDVHISTCQSGKWPLRVSNGDIAAPAPAQDVPEVGFGNMHPHAWAIQGSYIVFNGAHAEMDAKAEAKRCGGTCYAYPLYCLPPVAPNIQSQIVKDISAHEGGKHQLPPLPTTELAARGCAYCNHPLFLGQKCKSCGRVAQPVAAQPMTQDIQPEDARG